jgi:hypothetical protein
VGMSVRTGLGKGIKKKNITVDNLGSNTPPLSSLIDYQFRLFKAPIIRGCMDIYPVRERAAVTKIKLSWLFIRRILPPISSISLAFAFRRGGTAGPVSVFIN